MCVCVRARARKRVCRRVCQCTVSSRPLPQYRYEMTPSDSQRGLASQTQCTVTQCGVARSRSRSRSLSVALSRALSRSLSYSGTARRGSSYQLPLCPSEHPLAAPAQQRSSSYSSIGMRRHSRHPHQPHSPLPHEDLLVLHEKMSRTATSVPYLRSLLRSP